MKTTGSTSGNVTRDVRREARRRYLLLHTDSDRPFDYFLRFCLEVPRSHRLYTSPPTSIIFPQRLNTTRHRRSLRYSDRREGVGQGRYNYPKKGSFTHLESFQRLFSTLSTCNFLFSLPLIEAQNPCIGPPVDDPLGFRLRGYRLLPAPPTSSGQWPMSAYPEFELLPPPPPTFLSTSSPRRAQLPRFANVDEVVQFARGQVLARRDPMIERSLFFVVIYIGLLVGLAASVIIRRIINRNFWLFRIVRRPDGLLLVPHLHNCWSFMAGSFGFVFTVYNGISLANLLRQQPPKDACITLIYVWSPLYLGISWMAWAAAVAGTQNLYIRIKITRRWSIKARIPP
ncbi:hypothetical protein CF328_g8127, partial [Tilletia controversa]